MVLQVKPTTFLLSSFNCYQSLQFSYFKSFRKCLNVRVIPTKIESKASITFKMNSFNTPGKAIKNQQMKSVSNDLPFLESYVDLKSLSYLLPSSIMLLTSAFIAFLAETAVFFVILELDILDRQSVKLSLFLPVFDDSSKSSNVSKFERNYVIKSKTLAHDVQK